MEGDIYNLISPENVPKFFTYLFFVKNGQTQELGNPATNPTNPHRSLIDNNSLNKNKKSKNVIS